MFGKIIIFLGVRWELETLLQSRGAPGYAQAGSGSKAGQKQSCAWEVMYEFLCLAGQRSRSCGERAGREGICKAQRGEKWLLRLGLGGRRGRQGRAGLEERQRPVWVGDSGAPSWGDMACWEQLSLFPGPGLSAGPGWGLRTPGERSQLFSVVWLHSRALQPHCTWGNISVGSCSHTVLIPKSLHRLPFLSLPAAVWRKESTMCSRCGGERLF